jgi:hypothetical protein
VGPVEGRVEGKERKGKERKGKERKGKERKVRGARRGGEAIEFWFNGEERSGSSGMER